MSAAHPEGVGTALTQLAVVRGLRVVGIAGPSSQEHVRILGAEPVEYGDGWEARVAAVAGGPVCAAVDIAGAGVLRQLVA